MSYIVWKDGFNIGVKEMDEQHQIFVASINELYDALQSGSAGAIIVTTLEKLDAYIRVHFTAEENMLRSINCPTLETQTKQHEYYVSELNFLKSKFMDNNQTAQNTLLFLKDWFLHHIMNEDMKYVEFIEQKLS